MKYLISSLFILIVFTACNKKEVVLYDPYKIKGNKQTQVKKIKKEETKTIKIIKDKIDNNNTIIVIDVNTSVNDINNTLDINSSSDNNFTFDSNNTIDMNSSYDNNISNIELLDSINNKTAIIYSSKKIGKYSIKISDVVLAFSTNSKIDFDYKFFDIKDESEDSISEIFETLKEKNIVNVIFYITPNNLNNFYKYEYLDDFNIYLPLINKKETFYPQYKQIIFGAIDYKKQLDSLINISNSHIIEVYDEKSKNLKLHYLLEENKDIKSYQLKGKYPNYKHFIKQHRRLKNSSLILNLSAVKSSIFMSQITANDKLEVSQILTTQSNYTPLLFVLTQQKDRNKLIVATSIEKTNKKLFSITKLLAIDIRYDWVNYSTLIGLELFKTKNSVIFDNIEILDNQVQYPNILYKTKYNSFIPFVNK